VPHPDPPQGLAAPIAGLAVTGLAAYGIGAFIVPIDRDDLLLLSSVAAAPHPFGYFAGDWGLGNNGYRPLMSVTQWLLYQRFGVWALPSQLLSLALHLAAIALAFDIITRAGRQQPAAFRLLLGLAALLSPYTFSAATWTADRPVVMVALCLLAMVRHLYLRDSPPRAGVVVALSVLALLSKESGLLVPALAAQHGWMTRRPQLLGLGIATIAGYGALRLALFGSAAISYPESGYLLGLREFEDSASLSARQYVVMLIENPVKHVVATVLPVFDGDGAWLGTAGLWERAPFWLTTAGLAGLAWSKPTRAQRLALLIIVMNGVVHFAVYRYRTMYLAQLAFVIYLAASPVLAVGWRRPAATALAAILVVWSASASDRVAEAVARSYDAVASVESRDFDLADEPRLDRRILAAVEQRYSR